MADMQLMWIPESREERLEKEVRKMYEKTENMRKSLYAREAQLRKITDQLQRELEFLKSAICKEQKRTIF